MLWVTSALRGFVSLCMFFLRPKCVFSPVICPYEDLLSLLVCSVWDLRNPPTLA